MDANSVGERIRRARMAAGLQGKSLAENLGISRPYLTQIEKGLRIPASELRIRLANMLQVTPHWLLNGTHPSNSESPEKIDPAVRIADLERQLAIAQDTINNLSKALAQGRPVVAPASGACGGVKHAASDNRFVIGALLLSEPVISTVRRELKKLADGIRTEEAEIIALIREGVLKRDILEGEESTSAAAKVAKLYKTVPTPKKQPSPAKAVPEPGESAAPATSLSDALLAESDSAPVATDKQ